MNCKRAQDCWQLTAVSSDVERAALEADSTIDFMLRMFTQLDGEKLFEFAMVVWWLWKDRNSRVWSGSTIEARVAVVYARKFLADWSSASSGRSCSQGLYLCCMASAPWRFFQA
ncbi:hypothetical protein ACS0TY_003211 [Phlomoides rotata]